MPGIAIWFAVVAVAVIADWKLILIGFNVLLWLAAAFAWISMKALEGNEGTDQIAVFALMLTAQLIVAAMVTNAATLTCLAAKWIADQMSALHRQNKVGEN